MFAEEGLVKDELLVNPIENVRLVYALERNETIETVGLAYKDQNLTISVPSPIARKWVDSDQVGFEYQYAANSEHAVMILVEKDFQCLHKRPNEDESDHYPHPLIPEK